MTRALSQNQKTFNKVVRHARRQNAKSITPDGIQDRCLYRGPEGRKCFVGALIPNRCYKPEMEDDPCVEGVNNTVTNLLCELDHDLKLCRYLQDIHDSFPVYHWEKEFRRVAKEFGLIVPKN